MNHSSGGWSAESSVAVILIAVVFGAYTWAIPYRWSIAAALFVVVLSPYFIFYMRAREFACNCQEKMRNCGRAVRDFVVQHGRYPDEFELDTLAKDYGISATSDSRCAIVHYMRPSADDSGCFIVMRCDIRARILGSLSLKTVIELQKNGTLRRC